VNAFVTNTVAVTMTSTTITGTVAVTQSTSPWVVDGNLTHNNAAPAANNVGALVAVASSAAPTYTAGDQVLLSTDLSGNTRVTLTTALPAGANTIGAVTQASGPWTQNLTQVDGVALGAPSAYGTSPGAVTVVGVNAFITNVPAVSQSGTWNVTVNTALPAGSNNIGSVNQGTSPWVVSLTSTTITGAVAVTQSTSPWVVDGNLTHNNAAPAATNVGALVAVASAAAPTYTAGDQVLLSTDLAGNTRVTLTTALPAGANTIGAVNQGTSPWVTNVTQWDSTALGAPSAYGTSPGAVNVIGVNAFITNTVAVTLASTTITGTVAVTQSTSPWVVSLTSTTITGTVAVAGALTNNNAAPTATLLGVLPAIAETAYATVTYTTGDMVLPVTDLHGALNEDLQAWAGTALGAPTNFGTTPGAVVAGSVNSSVFIGTTVAVAASAGVQKVGISGATGVTLDAVITAATAPANALATLSVYQATQPSLTTGQSVALQNDSAGNLQISYGCNVTTGATLPTALNSVQYITGTTTIGAPIGKPVVVIQLVQTTTITAGAVTFEGTYDGTNWVTIPVAQVVHPETFALLTNPYTLVASTNQPFMILMQGYQNVRIRVSTAITGTGTITPQWDSRNHAPLQTVAVAASTAGSLLSATGSIGATKTAIKTAAGSVYGWYFYNSNTTVAYVQFFANTVAGVTLGTTAPFMSLGIPPQAGANVLTDVGIAFATSITIAITTTRAGATGPTNTVDYNVFYL